MVRRIFKLRSQGISPYHIAERLNDEKIQIPSDYLYAKLGNSHSRRTTHLWSAGVIRQIVRNPTYLGHLVQMKTTTVSYKNHKTVKKDPSEWAIIYNTHEPLVSQEIWDKCREVEESVSRGKKTKTGFVAPLSGLMFCADCGKKCGLAGTIQPTEARKSRVNTLGTILIAADTIGKANKAVRATISK